MARFTDEQIIQMIKEQEAGERTADVCRRCGVNQGAFYINGCLSRCTGFIELICWLQSSIQCHRLDAQLRENASDSRRQSRQSAFGAAAQHNATMLKV